MDPHKRGFPGPECAESKAGTRQHCVNNCSTLDLLNVFSQKDFRCMLITSTWQATSAWTKVSASSAKPWERTLPGKSSRRKKVKTVTFHFGLTLKTFTKSAKCSHIPPQKTPKQPVAWKDFQDLQSNWVHKTQNMVKLKPCSASFAVAAGALSCLPTTLAC